jgi:hypothetical protein
MRRLRAVFVVTAVVSIAIGSVLADEPAPVPVYTSEDLDRIFGPAAAQPSQPVDKSRPEDWRWVESFIDRQYARIDADRDYELRKLAIEPVEPYAPVYARSIPWGLGYPASTWWNVVASSYGVNTYWGQHGSHGSGGWSTGCAPARPEGGGRGGGIRGGGRGHGHAHK